MRYVTEFMNQYELSMIHSVAVAIISYVSIETKKIYKKHIDDKTKKEVVKTVCQAINQLYPDISGEEKLDKAIQNCKQILCQKGIEINDLELRMYIECTVNCFKMEVNNHVSSYLSK